MPTYIRYAYSLHCMRAHLGGFRPLTKAQFVALGPKSYLLYQSGIDCTK